MVGKTGGTWLQSSNGISFDVTIEVIGGNCYWDWWKITEVRTPWYFVYARDEEVVFYPALRHSEDVTQCYPMFSNWTPD